ncbi:MAG: hypothetical protein UHN47_05735 [Lachnospiraceae bacterium]|nr:hypothetical protein [Lachnospiraceae bacterium]
MMENKINIVVPVEQNTAAGYDMGRYAYNECKMRIDIAEKNIISFPSHVTRVLNSFFSGFFEELRKSMTPGEIKEHFEIESASPDNDFNTVFINYIKTN